MATISSYQTADGKRYRVRYRTPDNRQTDKRGFTTKREATAYAATMETAKLRGEYVAPSGGRTTVGALGQAWLDRQRGHVKPASIRVYESAWTTNVAPRWSSTPVGAVRRSDIQAWLADLGAMRGAETVRKAHRVLSAILADAATDRLVASNVAAGIPLPKRPERKHVYLTAQQLGALADECGRYLGLVLLLGIGGLRWGEASALTASDVDWLRRRVHLTRNNSTVNGRAEIGTLKSGESRTVALPQFVMTALGVAAAGKDRDALLWSTAVGGYLAPPASASWFGAAVRRCQATDETMPRVTPHDLRHTAASLAISSGANVKVVQRMLGHASASMTLDTYADLFESDLHTVAENVGKMWANVGNDH